MRFLLSLLCFALLAVTAFAGRLRYDGVALVRMHGVQSDNFAHQAALVALRKQSAFRVDFWTSNDIAIPAEHMNDVREFLANNGIFTEVMQDNVQKMMDEEQARLESRARVASGADFFSDYHSNDEINAFFANLTATYPQLVSSQVIGSTYEKNQQILYVITSNKTASANKPAIFYEGGIHAREWIAPATVSYIAYQLISQYGVDPTITNLVDSFTWIILPVVNVDGYIYTWETDRMWRKTRKPNSGSTCVGTDPNRNWDSHWCEEGADTDPCSDAYCGSAAFSEVEVKNVANFISAWQADSSRGKIVSFIDFHSYSQLWMGPYGYTAAKPKDFTAQDTASKAAVAAIKASSGKVYAEGPIYTTIYPASGSSADWGYDNAGIIYAFGVELRDQGVFGFLLPANQIVPTGQEIFAATLATTNLIQKNLASRVASA